MEKTDCFEVGRIRKTFGYKGEMIASVREGFYSTIEKEGSVFIETDGELVPYFFSNLEDESSDSIRLSFDEISDVDLARPLCGKEMWIPSDVIPPALLAEALELEIEGYEVSDINHGLLGTATGLELYPQHYVLKIRHGRREILVPYVTAYIHTVDHKEKRIVLQTPEGLIEAYLK